MRIVQLLSAVDAGEPLSVVFLDIDVMHACCVPTVAAGFENRTMTDLNFGVTGWS
jgi:hypothetical protein